MESVDVDIAVIGAGVIGLAIGAEMARRGNQVFLFESGKTIGCGISSRNSEVIHSGIYYPEASLKRRFCVEGRELLYAYCERHDVAYRKCGKLVVATSEAEIATLETIARQAKRNGVESVDLIDGKRAKVMEPALASVAALHVLETGIIDSHAYMTSLRNEIESGGGAVLCHHHVVTGRCTGVSFKLSIDTPSGSLLVTTRRLVVAAGLWSHSVAATLDGYDVPAVPPLTLAKGSYFSYIGRPIFTRLIYPAPVEGGLGTHLTLDLGGRMRFGPDVEWLATNNPSEIDFDVDPMRSLSFYNAIRRYWRGLPDGSLLPDYAGVRPKLSQRGEAAADFLIQGPQEHGIAGLVLLYGIESPGLTSSLAIARDVADRLV